MRIVLLLSLCVLSASISYGQSYSSNAVSGNFTRSDWGGHLELGSNFHAISNQKMIDPMIGLRFRGGFKWKGLSLSYAGTTAHGKGNVAVPVRGKDFGSLALDYSEFVSMIGLGYTYDINANWSAGAEAAFVISAVELHLDNQLVKYVRSSTLYSPGINASVCRSFQLKTNNYVYLWTRAGYSFTNYDSLKTELGAGVFDCNIGVGYKGWFRKKLHK